MPMIPNRPFVAPLITIIFCSGVEEMPLGLKKNTSISKGPAVRTWYKSPNYSLTCSSIAPGYKSYNLGYIKARGQGEGRFVEDDDLG